MGDTKLAQHDDDLSLMNQRKAFEHTESFCVLLLAVAVFVWKPGIYVSAGLISLYLIVRIKADQAFRQMVFDCRLARLSLALYALGLVTATLGAETYHDIAWMARKTLFLPVVVFLVFALKRQINKRLAMTGLLVSFWIATLLTLWEHNWQFQFGQRMEGTWPLGTWDSLQGLFFPFMVLYMCRHKLTPIATVIYGMTTVMAFIMLLLAGGRAPWLGAMLGLAIYFLFFKNNRQLLIGLSVTLFTVIVLSLTVFADRAEPVFDRLASVTDTTTNESNWIRLRLWDIGSQHLVSMAKQDPWSFAFGGGALSYDQKQIDYFTTLPYDPQDQQRLEVHGYPTGDTHNTYIDNALRHGVIWTVLMTLYLVWLCTRFSWTYLRRKPEPSMLLVGFLVVGMFYSMVPQFATFFFVLFVSLISTQSDSTSA